MVGRYLLEISTGVMPMAMAYGAYFDPAVAAWYVDGEVPAALQGCVVKQHPGAELGLWMNDAFVGTWGITAKSHTLHYAEDWLSREDAFPLSLSLPLMPQHIGHRGEKVRNYFENLLPDSLEVRERLAKRYGARSTDAFDLLTHLGRDCAGSLQVLPMGVPPNQRGRIEAKPLTDAEVGHMLRTVTTKGESSVDGDLRVALSGTQEKTALLRYQNQWCLPSGSTPTTHFIKLPAGPTGIDKVDLIDSLNNEWLCSMILREYGLPVATCALHQFDGIQVLVIERGDTRWCSGASEGILTRLAQEDICQALGLAPSLKYEADGGPGMDGILRLLNGSVNPDTDKRTFLQAQILFWMLRVRDNHAKNFSLRLHPGGQYELMPIYDVLSSYPVLGECKANWRLRDILRRYWISLGEQHGVKTADGQGTEVLINDLIERTPQVLQAVRSKLDAGFPLRIADSILCGLASSADRLVKGSP